MALASTPNALFPKTDMLEFLLQPAAALPVKRQSRSSEKVCVAGGSIVTIGSRTCIAALLGVPATSALVEMGPNDKPGPLPQEKFYVPEFILRMEVNSADPLASGLPAQVNMDFDNSPAFPIAPGKNDASARVVGWYSEPKLLGSGWAWGQQYLDGSTAILDDSIGAGKVFVFRS